MYITVFVTGFNFLSSCKAYFLLKVASKTELGKKIFSFELGRGRLTVLHNASINPGVVHFLC